MSNKKKLIPALRFPEFKEDGEWEDLLLSEVLEEHGIKSQGDEDVYSVSVHKGIINQIEHLGRSFAASNTDKYKRVLPGDIVYTKSPTGSFPYGIIKQSKIEYPVIVSPLYGVFTPKTKWLGSILDAYFEAPERTTNYLAPIVQKGAKNTINIRNDIFLSKSLVLPVRKKEQQKIASCLSSLDELIAAHKDKLDALKDHKKGLLQNLFPQEGETVPKVRFPEFEGDGEWVETTIEELIREKILFPPKDGNHGSIHPKSSDYVKTGIPFIMASDLKNGKIDFSKCAYLKKEQADLLQKGFAKNGDVLLTHKGTVGEVALLDELEYPYIMLTPQVTYYRIKDKSRLVNGFLAAFFNSDFFQKNLLKVSGGGTRAYVGITKQKEFDINFPKNPKEQQKIASCLSAVDELITAQQEKIEQLQQHKKGLMQGLFPKIER